MERPPCWPEGQQCPNPCAARLYRRTVWNETPLHGPWSGWRLAGARLVSPHGEWIGPHVLDRVLWREQRLFADLRDGLGYGRYNKPFQRVGNHESRE